MDTIRYIEWFACVVAVTAVLQLIQLPLRRKNKKLIYLISFVIKAMAVVVTAYACISIVNKFVWNLFYWPAALYAALFCDAITDLTALIIAPLRRKPRLVMCLAAFLTLIFVIYGTVNMETIVPKEVTFTSDKLKSTHRFVFIADLHYGSSQSTHVVDKALKEIANQKPDFVLLGGDITDEHTKADEMQEIYKKFGNLGTQTYFIYGNHDRQRHGAYLGGPHYTPEDLEKAINGSGLKILRDEIEVISDDLIILGRENESEGDKRCAVADLPKRAEDSYVVCVDHSPYEEEDIRTTGADLQLSGHTHAGQFFPLQYVYRVAVNNIYGYYKCGDTDLYVSSGISGWYFPFRTVARCNYVIVTLKPSTGE